MNNVNTSVGNTSVGEEEYTLYGKSSITEILRGLTFQISANSFFQTNTSQVCSLKGKTQTMATLVSIYPLSHYVCLFCNHGFTSAEKHVGILVVLEFFLF